MSYEIINSDCLKAMQEMPDGCIDAIVTDPPYGLSFMGAKWDSFNGSNGKQTTKERQDEGKMWCIKVATGAFVARRHGKIFITGNSGFPKSMDVGMTIDRIDNSKGYCPENDGDGPEFKTISLHLTQEQFDRIASACDGIDRDTVRMSGGNEYGDKVCEIVCQWEER